MNALEVGQQLVTLYNTGRETEIVDRYYGDGILSVEPMSEGDMARVEGIDALRAKHAWWHDQTTVNSAVAEGPYAGANDTQFVVRYDCDVSQNDERLTFKELGVYTVDAGKIVREEFLALQG